MIPIFRRMVLAGGLLATAIQPGVSAQDATRSEQPATRSKVIDEAGLFRKETVEATTRMLEAIQRDTGVQVVIEAVESLKGESIEDASVKGARLSGGQGVFVLIAKEERRLRLLTRRQVEQRVPEDRRAAIREAFLEGFKAGDFDEGLRKGVSEIAIVLKATAAAEPATSPLVARDQIRLTQAGARKALAAAEAKAARMNVKMNIAVVDDGGHLLLFARMDGARPASAATAQTKAISAATFRQATGPIPPGTSQPDLIVNLGLAAAAASGGARITTLYGGIPIVVDGQVVGGLGVAGGTGEQDAEVARAGVDAVVDDVKKPAER